MNNDQRLILLLCNNRRPVTCYLNHHVSLEPGEALSVRDDNMMCLSIVVGGFLAGVALLLGLLFTTIEHPLPF